MTTQAERITQLEQALARLEADAAPTPTPSSVNPDGWPGHVAPGELVESAWGNAVADKMSDLRDHTKFVTWGGRDNITTDATGAFLISLRIPPAYIADMVLPPAVVPICANPAYGIWLTLGTITSTTFDGRAYTVTAGAAAPVTNLAITIIWVAVGQRSI